MKRNPSRPPVARARIEAENPLWIVTAALAVFAAFAVAAIALG